MKYYPRLPFDEESNKKAIQFFVSSPPFGAHPHCRCVSESKSAQRLHEDDLNWLYEVTHKKVDPSS